MNKCHPEFSKWLKSIKIILLRHTFRDTRLTCERRSLRHPSFHHLSWPLVSHTHWTVKIWRSKAEALQFAAFGEARKVSVQSPSTFAPGKKGPEASKTDCAAKITPISLDCMVGVSKETVTFPSRGAAPNKETITFSFWTQQPAKNSLIGRTTVVFTSAGKSTVVRLFPLILPPSCWQTGMVVVVLLVVVLVVQVVVLVVLLGWYGR